MGITQRLAEDELNRILGQYDRDRFARIEPIVGSSLFTRRVAIFGSYGAARIIEYLASCGILSFDLIETKKTETSRDCPLTMLEQLRARLQIDITGTAYNSESFHQALEKSDLSLLIGTGGREEYELIRTAVEKTGQTAIFYRTTGAGQGFITFLLPGETIRTPDWLFESYEEKEDLFTELHLSNVVANFAKGLLLAGTRYARADIENVISSGVRILMVGHPSWPWAILPVEPTEERPAFLKTVRTDINQDLSGRTCLVIGLGSLGSVVADTLYRLKANLILIDGKEVAAANPIRQIYGLDQVGETKSRACVERLSYLQSGCLNEDSAGSQWFWRHGEQWLLGRRAEITERPEALSQLVSLLAEHRPDIAVVATGTEHDRAISNLLRDAKIPHVVVSCYARARFFEAIVVDKTGPCFGCVRGHLYLGSQPSLTPEQRARYVSSEHDLAAEPATRIETARAADMAAHIAAGFLQPESADWLRRALDEEQTFFLGGNTVEIDRNGDYVYGIEWPGQVRLYGLQEITGRGSYVQCWDCNRQLPIAIQYTS